MIKKEHQSNEGKIMNYGFNLSSHTFLVSISETKWHDGEKKKRTPIWWSKIREGVYALFVWKVAFIIRKKGGL